MFIPYANNKGADQPAHSCSLISTFIVRYLDSIIPLLAIAEISRLKLASVAEHAGLCLTWSQTPKTGFLVTWLIYIGIIKCSMAHEHSVVKDHIIGLISMVTSFPY